MPACVPVVEFFGNDLYIGLLEGMILALIGLPLPIFSGMLIENAFDIIKGKNRRQDKLNKKYSVALDCVHQAEEKIPGTGVGAARFALALDLYQEIMGGKALDDDNIVQTMFNLSNLSH